jgi:signal transduction histidine kinase
MIIKITLVISIILQVVAAVAAIRLTRLTKYNLAWILITAGFLLMAVLRIFELMPVLDEKIPIDMSLVYTWLGLFTSLLFSIGVLLIRRIFNFIKKVEQSRREAEKRLINAIIQTEEKERRRFAKDLHDGLGPLLSTVKLSVSTLNEMENDTDKKHIIQNADLIINESIKSIKEISNNLSPHVLNNFGLASALKNFTNKIQESKAININFDSNAFDQRYDENIEVVLYRVTCELINNTLKHANAKNIEILLTHQPKLIIISYSDDGIGFNVNEVIYDNANPTGMGYKNIISRINTIKGKIDIESNRETGTKIQIRVKL